MFGFVMWFLIVIFMTIGLFLILSNFFLKIIEESDKEFMLEMAEEASDQQKKR